MVCICRESFQAIFSVVLGILCQYQTNGFSFKLETVGTEKKTAAIGDVLTYNARLKITETTHLKFFVDMPHHNKPIMNIDSNHVTGVGANIDALEPTVKQKKSHWEKSELHSQEIMDFGNVTVKDTGSALASANELVIQVKVRLLKQTPNVTNGAVFWMYFGMAYKNEVVRVIGKSFTTDLQTGPARIQARMFMQKDSVPNPKFGFNVQVKFYHLPGSRSKATDVKVTLSVPSSLVFRSSASSPSSLSNDVTVNGNIITVKLTESFVPGEIAKVKLKFDFGTGLPKGKFAKTNIYGDLEYKTMENDCERIIQEKDGLQFSKTFYVEKDTCDDALNREAALQTSASSAKLPCCGPEQSLTANTYGPIAWEPWGNSSVRLADEYIQRDFKKKTTITRFLVLGYKTVQKFVKTFFVSYSQNGVFWKYISRNGKPQEFIALSDAESKVFVVLDSPVTARFFRFHVGKRSPKGAALKLAFHGCTDEADVMPYEIYQRGFLAKKAFVVLCNVHPDRSKAKTNCYRTEDGLQWKAMHPSIVNVIGYDPNTDKMYGLGVTSEDTPIYMEIVTPQNFRVISEADWTAVKSGCQLSKIIPLFPVHGNPFFQLTGTDKSIGDGVSYVATPEGLLKIESGATRMIAMWAEYKI